MAKEEMYNLDGKLVPITQDLIRSLRLEGRGGDARRMLEAFRESCNKQKREDYKIFNNEAVRKDRFRSMVKGLCVELGCKNKAKNGYHRCELHLEKRRGYRR